MTNRTSRAAAAAFLLVYAFTGTAHATPELGATAPYNEAVKFINGKRTVELAPFPNSLKYILARAKTPAQSGSLVLNIFEVETPAGLMDCNGVPYFHPKLCSPSTFGTVKLQRQWAVKLNGHWQMCIGRLKPIACIPMVQDGVLRGLPTPEEE